MNYKKLQKSTIWLLMIFLLITSCAQPSLEEGAKTDTPVENVAGSEQKSETNLPSLNKENENLPQEENSDNENIKKEPTDAESFSEVTPTEQQPTELEPSKDSNATTPPAQIDDYPIKERYGSLQELFAAAGVKIGETNTNAIVSANADSDLYKYYDYFYVPTAIPEGYTLYRITVWEYNIQYRYKLIADPDNDKMNITVTYANPNRFKGKEPMQPLVNQLGISLTEDGFLYYAKEGVVAFPVGDSRMTIQVPESMNTYEQLKSLCAATRYEVDAEHRGE